MKATIISTTQTEYKNNFIAYSSRISLFKIHNLNAVPNVNTSATCR